jgi:hypothetical protein
MIKQWTYTALIGVLVSMTSPGFAAREEHSFEVSVSIPTPSFYVIPVETDWIHLEQTLPWNGRNATLGSLSRNFDVRHDAGAIKARLETVPYLSNGTASQNIPLRVYFNGAEVDNYPLPRQVVAASDAMRGARVPLVIEPQRPYTGYKPGTYYGNVVLVFSAAAP